MSVFQKKIINLFPSSFGLDLSDLSIKAVWLEREGNRDVIRSYGSVPLPSGAIIDGEIIDATIVEEAIKTLLKKSGPAKISTKKSYLFTTRNKSFSSYYYASAHEGR